jgi:hypothetical protein
VDHYLLDCKKKARKKELQSIIALDVGFKDEINE